MKEKTTADLKVEECKLDADATCLVCSCQRKVAGVLLRLNSSTCSGFGVIPVIVFPGFDPACTIHFISLEPVHTIQGSE